MRIGILTGGGDCPGLNAVIRAVVRTADSRYGSTVVGFQDGWRGLLEDRKVQMRNEDRIDRIRRARRHDPRHRRVNPQKRHDGLDRIKADPRRQRHRRPHPDRRRGHAHGRQLARRGAACPSRRPEDDRQRIDCTDVTFGFDTALTIATEAIDRLHTTAESHQRVMLVEVMGRHAGWIALQSGMASGAQLTLVPEVPFDVDEVCALVKKRFQRGDSHFICVVAEGAAPDPESMTLREGGIDEFGHKIFTGVAQQLAVEIERRIGKEVRTTVLGHVQRGGTPTPYDRVLATRFGVHATDAAHNGQFGQMVALHGTNIELVPLCAEAATKQTKTVPSSATGRRPRSSGTRRINLGP